MPEVLDVTDALDRVVGSAERTEVHRRGLLHRAVHLFVQDASGRLLLQQRSMLKDEFPGCWTSSASGHVDAGETYVAAAQRELAEELGLDAPIRFVGKWAAAPQLANEHSALFEVRIDAEQAARIAFPPEEVSAVRWIGLRELFSELSNTPDEFAEPFRVLLYEHLRRLRA